MMLSQTVPKCQMQIPNTVPSSRNESVQLELMRVDAVGQFHHPEERLPIETPNEKELKDPLLHVVS